MLNILISALLVFFGVALLLNTRWLLGSIKHVRGVERSFFIAWILLFVGVAVYFSKGDVPAGRASMNLQNAYQLACVSVAGVIALFLAAKTSAISQLSKLPIMLLFLYGLLGVMSAAYSTNPSISLYKGSMVLIDALLVCVAISLFRDKEKIRCLFNVSYFLISIFAVGALWGAIYAPEVALRPINGGAFGFVLDGTYPKMNGNELGFLGAVTAVTGFRRYFENESFTRKIFWIANFLVGMLVLVLSQARTSLATAMLALLFLTYIIPRLRKYALLGALLAIPAVLYISIIGNIEDISGDISSTTTEFLAKGQSEGGMQTLIGRMHAWEGFGMEMFKQSPILGHGYDAGVADVANTHMHNAHIQILVNSGLLGYVVWLPMVLIVMFNIFATQLKSYWPAIDYRGTFHAGITVVMMMILLRSITGSVLVTHHWSLMLFMAAMIYSQVKEVVGEQSEATTLPDDNGRGRNRRILRRKQRTLIEK